MTRDLGGWAEGANASSVEVEEGVTMMYWYGNQMSGWGYAFGILGMVLFWGVLIVAIVAAVRYATRDRHERWPAGRFGPTAQPPAAHLPMAEQILAERFARGEIDADEYRHRLETLHQGGRSGKAATRS